ncbi:MAG: putative N-acetyltransferase [Symbiobacteriaceae bacterium]|jgi:RimJ/RimL family protein N-acetyltransferase|nr:putative N-acetyltransferase [Symbiobacteriaceae bacterium]
MLRFCLWGVNVMRSFDQVTLRTARLVLRPLREDDASDLFEIFSDPAVMRFWSTPPWSSAEMANHFIARTNAALASGEYLQIGIERQTDGRIIGTCSLFSFSEQCKRAEVGYALAHAAWGHGFMHEALSALLDWAFSDVGLNRIEADIDPRNEASARTLRRLGFQEEGFLRERWIVNGEVTDTALYGLLRRDWAFAGASPSGSCQPG